MYIHGKQGVKMAPGVALIIIPGQREQVRGQTMPRSSRHTGGGGLHTPAVPDPPPPGNHPPPPPGNRCRVPKCQLGGGTATSSCGSSRHTTARAPPLLHLSTLRREVEGLAAGHTGAAVPGQTGARSGPGRAPPRRCCCP